ncbi:APH(3') family aminoglycoside O-phosphotransferase [Beduini massiliensis]|uniref:APH(3') family aminoglycoside O-phosphotransferase n=1 Tax=Beduini massiliensis TaxID=1585974 RepID=UPI0006932DAC|nr:APH(3') family aminoglycoside O-phosphotransferase [Beduini massiliensis]
MFEEWIRKYEIAKVTENQVGCSEDGVYFLTNNKQNYYLKISRNKEILNEVKAYRYLEGKLNVPKVYEFIEKEGQHFLLMSEVKGRMLYELLKEDIQGTIKLYASALKMLHELPIEDYPIQRDLSEWIQTAQKNLPNVDLDTLEDITKARGLEATFERLVALRPLERDLVVCHGDFCMPNVLVGDQIGFIDLGRSGVDDRYQDIALALRSLKTNIEMIHQPYLESYTMLFLETYGIDKIDERKREFYFLLDEFY